MSTARLEGSPALRARNVAVHRVVLATAALWLGVSPQAGAVSDLPWTPEQLQPWPGESPPHQASAGTEAPPAPVDAATIARLLGEAEAAYGGGRWGQALEAFKAVTAFDASNPLAWLRIGNLHQRRGNLLAAASAYRRASAAAPTNGAGPAPRTPDTAAIASEPLELRQIRIKASINLATVNLELAEAALERAHSLGERLPQGSGLEASHQALASRAAEVSGRIEEAGEAVRRAAVATPASSVDRADTARRRPARRGAPDWRRELDRNRAVETLRGTPQP